jgi:hypothetical protein
LVDCLVVNREFDPDREVFARKELVEQGDEE